MTRTLRLPIAVMAVIIIAAMWFASAAQAQMVIPVEPLCGDRTRLIAELAMRYGETRQGAALPRSVMPREFYGSEKTGTWTILKTHMRGRACIEAAGKGWKGNVSKMPIIGTGA